MIDISTNLISGISNDLIQLTANHPTEKEVLIWSKSYKTQQLVDFTRLGIQAQFRSWISDAVSGEYGLKLLVNCKRDITASVQTIYPKAEEILQKGLNITESDWNMLRGYKINWKTYIFETWATIQSKTNDWKKNYFQDLLQFVQDEQKAETTYVLYLNTDDMYGDVYNFDSFFQHEKVFDISSFGAITGMDLYFYQKPCNSEHEKETVDEGFHLKDGSSFEYQDFLGNAVAPNLFVKDFYICVGYNLADFNKEQATLHTLGSTTYIANSQVNDENNTKQITLRWVHEFDNNKIAVVTKDTKLDYKVRWYRYTLGAPSADEYCGVYWTLLRDIEVSSMETLIDDPFIYTLTPDTTLEREQIKAIIFYNGEAIRTNVITFSNEKKVPNGATIDVMSAVRIVCADDTYGNYLIYGQGNQLLEPSESKRCRTLECHFDSDSYEEEAAMLAEATFIEWRFPASNTMLRAADETGAILDYSNITELNKTVNWSYQGMTGISKYSYDNTTNEIVIHREYSTQDGVSIHPLQQYYIYGYYASYNTNNTIKCIVFKDKIEYLGTKECTFGVAGTSGTDCTLVIDFDNNETAVTIGANEACSLTARLYDSTNQLVDLKGHGELSYEWSWFCNTRNIEVASVSNLPKKPNNYKVIDLSYTAYADNQEKPTPTNYYFYNEASNSYDKDTKMKFDENAVYYELVDEVDYSATGLSIRMDPNFNFKAELVLDAKYRTTNANEAANTELQKMMNSIYIAQLTVKGWGDYDLVAYKVIPLRRWINGERYMCITGPDSVIYPSSGEAIYYKDPYQIWLSPREANKEGTGSWRIICPHYTTTDGRNNKTDVEKFVGILSNKNILQPTTVYIQDAPQYGVQFVDSVRNMVAWTQPILTIQNNYPSAMVNKWDGKSIVTDEATGTMMASAISAGKKESDNTFSGVLIGDWSRSDTEAAVAGQTGVYGFNHGAMSYAFKDNGTGFIGKPNKGRIYFDGDSSQIYSSSWYANTVNNEHNGMLIDLDDGYLHMNQEGGYDAVMPTAEEFNANKTKYYRYAQYALADKSAGYQTNQIYYLPSNFTGMGLSLSTYLKNTYFIRTETVSEKVIDHTATKTETTTATSRASVDNAYKITTTVITSETDKDGKTVFYKQTEILTYTLATGSFDEKAAYYKPIKWSIALTENAAAGTERTAEINENIFNATNYFYEYKNTYVQMKSTDDFDLNEQYYIKTSQTPHYITIGANETLYPIAVGTAKNTSDRTFRVAWDGTTYITNGEFTGRINAVSGTLGTLEVLGTLSGGTIIGAEIYGSLVSGGIINGAEIYGSLISGGRIEGVEIYYNKNSLDDFKNEGFYLNSEGLNIGGSNNTALITDKSTYFSNITGKTTGTLGVSGLGLDLYSNTFVNALIDNDVYSTLHIGWDQGAYTTPYIRFGLGSSVSDTGVGDDAGLIKKFPYGMWIGTWACNNDSGVSPSAGEEVTGIFCNSIDNTVYRCEKIGETWVKEAARYARFA